LLFELIPPQLRRAPRRRRLPFALLTMLSFTGAANAESPTALTALEHSGARITAEVVDLDSGTVIQQLNPDQRLSPASLTKLVIASAALESWAADRTFQTRVLGSGDFRDGHVGGDLILQGAGDATFENAGLWVLAAQIRGAGVSEIKGRVVVVPAPFGPVSCETKDRCDALKRSSTAYNAQLSSVGVDYGNWCVDVRPTTPGSDAVVGGCSLAQLPIPIQGSIRTVASREKPSFWVDRVTTEEGEMLRVGGDIPSGEGQRVYRAMSDPALGVGLLLRETLREVGIAVPGNVVVEPRGVPANSYPLAQADGLSLKEQLGRMLRFSNNYIADVLTLDLAAETAHTKPSQLSGAGKTLSEYVGRIVNTGSRSRGEPVLLSGSGLTPENELSASDLVALLAHQYRNTRTFPAFYGGLVVPRQAPFAFLRQGNSDWLDRVALKTGTMDDPYSVCGIAGYMRKKDGGWMAFGIIVNGGPNQRHVPLYKAMEAARGDLEALLSKY
jgi:D-alanyl-D-alanine carboxypeptidase/D-alanyl-D-alanine-endopeptidase (penicillin-binding protein 4)